MFPRNSIACLVAAAFGLMLSGCGKTYTYKYKITMSVRDHGELKTASNIVSVSEGVGWDGNSGYAVLCGEATAVPLKNGSYVLALLKGPQRSATVRGFRWRSGPTGVLLHRLGMRTDWTQHPAGILSLKQSRKVVELQYSEMPDIVSFKNAQDPTSITTIDPASPGTDLGEGVQIERVTLQGTEEPISRGKVERLLPWLNTSNSFIDGSKFGERVSSYLSRDFSRCNRWTEWL
ncbi:MAG TPA: hypothetical protein VJL82_06390 [Rhizomicrobium sp.]|nr:hypothetical protein [Rhizomicrobium sp.]